MRMSTTSNAPLELQKFAADYPEMYRKFFEMNRALAKLQRKVGELSRGGGRSQPAPAEGRDSWENDDGMLDPNMELD